MTEKHINVINFELRKTCSWGSILSLYSFIELCVCAHVHVTDSTSERKDITFQEQTMEKTQVLLI